ncbi:hypothetical protein FIBSPDRAFT_173011, partial [Athelia psychrophila]
METCSRQMEISYKTHPVQALVYASKHDYPAVANLAAKLALFSYHLSVYMKVWLPTVVLSSHG